MPVNGVRLTLLLLMGLVVWARVIGYEQHLRAQACVNGEHRLDLIVHGLTRMLPNRYSLDVAVDDTTSTCAALRGARLRLSWRGPQALPVVSPGDRLRVLARLSRPQQAGNPAGFDYARWLQGKGMLASGYIADMVTHTPDVTAGKVRALPPDVQNQGLLRALLFGDTAGVTRTTWTLLRETGTVHLFVVSGLHASVLGGLVFGCAYLILRLLGIARRPGWSARTVAGWVSVCALVGYAGFLDWQAPIMRATLSVCGFWVLLLLGRRMLWWLKLLFIAMLMLLLFPQMFWQSGFWLSFAAVTGLAWWLCPRQIGYSAVLTLVGCQCVLAVWSVPGVLWQIGAAPLTGLSANLITVPAISLITLPSAVAAYVCSAFDLTRPIGTALFVVADFSLTVALHGLRELQADSISVHLAYPFALGLAAASAFLALLPMSCWVRGWACLMCFLPSIAVFGNMPWGEFRILSLNVGQGSAGIVDTLNHRLIVDTGARYPPDFDYVEGTLLPSLRVTGAPTVAAYLVSHWDNDHAGGLVSLVERWGSAPLIEPHSSCPHGKRWRWDGVTFTLLRSSLFTNSNDASCTLLVSNRRRQAYLAGDITWRVERRLVTQLPRGLDFLLVPHHGSRTSSSRTFVRWTRPRIAVVSAGARNSFGHPHAQVVERYHEFG
ncbi:MAG: DNA internalization-related competence protein ComEC/Rec2, partial [Pseudomonadota bacterium]